ncbi:Lysine exporter protein (LYSE/YGGA) [Paenibacillus curdlanolyticus YK9]|uniref:Lysine exporter protein (LYSE/YGGA) n=1 Tax=Paenibacillus curdlanolyticus YK9 TaxID=717606 RepID=E0I328_9BACL|nr:LysE family translocator [Paenibacillus curdlanolyticus]EFM12692.1 Lysine exporter protein (LYSE/YGGA) [Paenibacillus curdlanolyticus YK9]
MSILLKGIMIGLSIAAPVGPIGILCMKRTLNQGRAFGIVSGFGAATADAVYGLIAAVGFTLITEQLLAYQTWIRLIGGLFLCYLGLQAIVAKPQLPHQEDAASSRHLLAAYLTTFFLTIMNPMTILSFLGVFAGVNAAGASHGRAVTMVVGIFVGSMLWWLLLAIMVGLIRDTLTRGAMVAINRISGCLLVGFGLYAIGRMLV